MRRDHERVLLIKAKLTNLVDVVGENSRGQSELGVVGSFDNSFEISSGKFGNDQVSKL